MALVADKDVRVIGVTDSARIPDDAILPAIRTDAGWYVGAMSAVDESEPRLHVDSALVERSISDTASERVFRFTGEKEHGGGPARRQSLVVCQVASPLRCSAPISIEASPGVYPHPRRELHNVFIVDGEMRDPPGGQRIHTLLTGDAGSLALAAAGESRCRESFR